MFKGYFPSERTQDTCKVNRQNWSNMILLQGCSRTCSQWFVARLWPSCKMLLTSCIHSFNFLGHHETSFLHHPCGSTIWVHDEGNTLPRSLLEVPRRWWPRWRRSSRKNMGRYMSRTWWHWVKFIENSDDTFFGWPVGNSATVFLIQQRLESRVQRSCTSEDLGTLTQKFYLLVNGILWTCRNN